MEPQGGYEEMADGEGEGEEGNINEISPVDFIDLSVIPLLEAYTEQIGKVLEKSEDPDKETKDVIMMLQNASASAMGEFVDQVDKTSPEFDAALIKYLSDEKNGKKLRRALFNYRRAHTYLSQDVDYYNQALRDACAAYEDRLSDAIIYLNQCRFGKRRDDDELVVYMTDFLDFEMVIYDMHHILKALVEKKINHGEASIAMMSNMSTFNMLNGAIKFGRETNKGLVDRAYKEAKKDKWIKKQVGLLRKYTQEANKLDLPEKYQNEDFTHPCDTAEEVLEAL